MIKHYWDLTKQEVPCGATGVDVSQRWVNCECLACVAIAHPNPDQRRRALVMFGGLPDRDNPTAVESWLRA